MSGIGRVRFDNRLASWVETVSILTLSASSNGAVIGCFRFEPTILPHFGNGSASPERVILASLHLGAERLAAFAATGRYLNV